MCRVPKILLVAPDDVRMELRRKLSSISYEIVAAVATLDEAAGINVDVAVLWEPAPDVISAARERGLKSVAIGGAHGAADLDLATDDAADLKTRIWELFRPS
jgi:hypothetical protein